MAIDLQARPLLDLAVRLNRAFGNHWKIASNTRADLTSRSAIIYLADAESAQAEIVKLLGAQTLNDFSAAFEAVYGWTPGTFNQWRVSADQVQNTLVPAAIAAIKLVEADLMPTGTGAEGKKVYPVLSPANQTAIDAVLADVVAEYTV